MNKLDKSARERMSHHGVAHEIDEHSKIPVTPFNIYRPICAVCRGGPIEKEPFHVASNLCIFPSTHEYDSVFDLFLV